MGIIPHDITVIVVSDFEPGEKHWGDEIEMAKALARQDIGAGFSVVMVESEVNRTQIPPNALFEALPDVQLLYHDSDRSAALKDYATVQVETPWVAVLEADALPDVDWLRCLADAVDDDPDVDIISGRTYYGEETVWRRVLNLLDRSFDDQGERADTVHISNNGALYRTEVLKAFPYPDAPTPFASSRQRNRQILDSGATVRFTRSARMRHAIGGWAFLWDFRRNTGYADMAAMQNRSLKRVPGLLWSRLRQQIGAAVRVGPTYLRLFDWPLWFAMLFVVRVPEMVGMVEAVCDRKENVKTTLHGSAYR